MEVWKVVGFRKCNFKGNDGADVRGTKLYLARQPENEHIVGLETLSLFISGGVDYEPAENEMVQISYNRYGKVASVTPCEV